jgi:ribosomal biogenesis protein LAS1
MAWLLQNYFLPILNPVPNDPPILTPVRHLVPSLKLYKNTMKTVIRDKSLMTQHKPRLRMILRDLEKWIAESRVGADIATGESRWQTNHWSEGHTTDDVRSEGNLKELWVLEQFCQALAEKGMLVPLSKKFEKSPLSSSKFTDNPAERGNLQGMDTFQPPRQ